ncbi:MAG: Fe-S cluster assembly protein SufD [Alphaproteobacteria bacterium]
MLTSANKEHYLSDFRQDFGNGGFASPAWLKALRESAIGSFERLGFPNRNDEDWKYTSVEPIVSQPFERERQPVPVSGESILSRSFTDAACNRLVFVNGTFVPELSLWRDVPAGVRVQSLADAIRRDEQILAPYLAACARHEREAFFALNTAFMEDGAVVIVPSNCRLESPLHLIFVANAGEKRIAFYPRNLLLVGAGSEAKIVESYLGLGTGAYFVDAVTELVGEENSSIDYYRLQRESDTGFHVGAVDARMKRNCRFTSHAITLAGSLVRNDVHVALEGEGAECILNGMYLLDGREHVDNHTEIEHRRPRTTSVELYKGILSGHAHGVFNGKIVVHKDAQKTDARQTNKNLLLSEHAAVNTKPQLEIYADDVKCSHGSTIGQLDADALFYLRSRGLDNDEAQSLLSYAFASDVVGRIRIPFLRSRLDEYLLSKFGRN